MASDEEKAPTAPYVSFTTFSTALDNLASHGLPNKIDRSVFPSFNGVIQGQLLGTMRFLGLIDEKGAPQQPLEELVTADEEKRKTALRKILKARYDKLFSADLKKIAPSQFDQLMGEYGVTGATRTKAKSFFLKAAQWSGIELSPLLKTRKTGKRNGAGRPRRAARTTPAQPPKPTGEERYSKSIRLPEAGGILTLSGTFDPFALRDQERELVYGITDMMTAFEESAGRDKSGMEDG